MPVLGRTRQAQPRVCLSQKFRELPNRRIMSVSFSQRPVKVREVADVPA